jgi:hypothetical protein
VAKFIKFWFDRARDSFSRARGIVELALFILFLLSKPLSANFQTYSIANVVWLGGVVLFLAVFIVEVCFVAPYRYAQRIENKLNELAARPPPTEFKLIVSPGHEVKSDDPNSVFVNLSLSNDSTPPAELHNIDGEFRTDQRFVLDAATQPTKWINAKAGPAVFAYYHFSLAMLHKNTSIQIAEWKFRTPSEGESIPIGIDVVSSETPQQRKNWRVVRDGEHVRINPAPQ